MFTGLDMCNKYKNKEKNQSVKKTNKQKKTVIRTNQSLFEKIDLTDGSTSNEFGVEGVGGVRGVKSTHHTNHVHENKSRNQAGLIHSLCAYSPSF